MAEDHRSADRFTDEERLRSSPQTRDHVRGERFSDEESEFLRHVRLGELPARARRRTGSRR